MWLSFMSGALALSTVPKDNYDAAIGKDHELLPEMKAKGIKLTRVPMLDITHTSFNMEDPIVGKNKLLRCAISMADDQVTTGRAFL